MIVSTERVWIAFLYVGVFLSSVIRKAATAASLAVLLAVALTTPNTGVTWLVAHSPAALLGLGVLAMYLDQGLVPFKVLAIENGVNFTAGLPIVRTSPDHGTAFDIAGKNMASPDSFRQALYMAIDIYRNRKNDSEVRSNPLRKLYFEKRDDSDKLKLD